MSDRVQDETGVREHESNDPLYVVGIGASAGGLEALELLFESLPGTTGMAFVVVQHLSPDFKSHMEELLARKTSMAIHRVEQGMRVEPDSIYLIPPRTELSIAAGRMQLIARDRDGSPAHPIDHFFSSLAKDRGRGAVAIVLSGTGSDGSRGIRDVHEAGGLVLAQDERSSKFDGMPLSAVATGVVDIVLPPQQIAEALMQYSTERLSPTDLAGLQSEKPVEKGVDRVFELLHTQNGIDFSHYRATTVSRRIRRRMDFVNTTELEDYIRRLDVDPTELNELYKDLLIGVTRFFRDREAFAVLQQRVIPGLFDAAGPEAPIRVWVAGCASGEEAYSIAILMDEESRRRQSRAVIKIFATDAHHGSLNAAARGVYPEECLQDMNPERRARYFRRHRDGFQVSQELRSSIVFAPHNLINDPPFTQMNLVTCRNLLIYLQPMAQKKVLSMFHFALGGGGILFLGPSETPGDLLEEFNAIDKRWRIYSKRRDIRLPPGNQLPFLIPGDHLLNRRSTAVASSTTRIDPSMIAMYDQLLDRRMPTSILVSEDFSILHIFGGAERFLQARGGRPSNNLKVVIAEGLRTALLGALQHASRKHAVVRYSGIHVATSRGNEVVNLLIEPFDDRLNGVPNYLVEFQQNETEGSIGTEGSQESDITDVHSQSLTEMASELRHSQENLQASIEEMETSNEELQATNEELIASNEELQSTNEELHSVNEELYTVNAEYQRRVDELALANSDMDNLLATTRVGVIFLDRDLCIRRFTPEVGRLLHLLPQDVGRSIQHFAHHLLSEDILAALQDVLANASERELQAVDHNGTPFLVRILPYRTGDQTEGIVLTLIDIGTLKAAEAEIARFQFMTEASTDPVSLLDDQGRYIYVNNAVSECLKYSREELLRKSITDINGSMDEAAFQQLFRQASQERVRPFESEWLRRDGTVIPVEVSVSSVVIDGSRYLTEHVRDITERIQADRERRVHDMALESAMNGILITDATRPDNPIQYANPGFFELTGYSRDEVIGRNCRFLQGPETDPLTIAALRESIARHLPCRVSIRNYRRDGTPFWNDLQIAPVMDERGRVVNFVGVQHDVTNRVEAEEASRRYAQRIAGILNSTAEGIYGVDTAGNCTFCNAAAVRLLGYESQEDLVGQNMHALVHHQHADEQQMSDSQCRIQNSIRQIESVHAISEVFWRKDGSSFPVEYRSEPLISEGRLTGAVVSFQDITDRLRYLRELEQMGTMINASHDAILVWELDGPIKRWNRGATRLYGYNAESAIGQLPQQLLQTRHVDGQEEIRAILLDAGEWFGILEQRTSDGQLLMISSRRQLLTTEDGSRQILEINRDITEQHRIHNKLKAANRAVRRASKAKSIFLANISHELRTPMTAVLGFSEMLRSHSNAPEYLDKVDTIRRNGEYLLALLNDILDLSKIEADKISVNRESVDLAMLMEDVRVLMNARAQEEGIPLHFEVLSPVPAFITADRTRVRQILVNLIGNAIKFTDHGEVRVRMDVARDKDQSASWLRIRVQDTGIGMTEKQLRTLFRPFTQATSDTARQFGGTGLGLSISKRLAEELDGRILVSSVHQQGSCFTLMLPIQPEHLNSVMQSAVMVSPSERPGPSNDRFPRFNARVLLADDRRDVWRVARYFLEKCGAEVEIAEDGRQAVDAVSRASESGQAFDLILMDMQMPVMTGQEAVQKLRSNGCRIPIIALTANAMEGERDSCLKMGCDDYAPKPIDGPALMQLVARHLSD